MPWLFYFTKRSLQSTLEPKEQDMDFSRKTSFFKRALFKRAGQMSQFDFRETTTEEWNRIILELLEVIDAK